MPPMILLSSQTAIAFTLVFAALAQLPPLTRGPRASDRAPRPAPQMNRGEFVEALTEFRAAIAEFGSAISLDAALEQRGLDKKAREIQKPIGRLSDYLKETDVKAPEFNAAEFVDFSDKDLAWETLTTAERTESDLRLALRALDAAERENVITIQALQFIREIQGDLARLKWLTSRVEDRLKPGADRR